MSHFHVPAFEPVRIPAVCATCNGAGRVTGPVNTTCTTCNGSGAVLVTLQHETEWMRHLPEMGSTAREADTAERLYLDEALTASIRVSDILKSALPNARAGFNAKVEREWTKEEIERAKAIAKLEADAKAGHVNR